MYVAPLEVAYSLQSTHVAATVELVDNSVEEEIVEAILELEEESVEYSDAELAVYSAIEEVVEDPEDDVIDELVLELAADSVVEEFVEELAVDCDKDESVEESEGQFSMDTVIVDDGRDIIDVFVEVYCSTVSVDNGGGVKVEIDTVVEIVVSKAVLDGTAGGVENIVSVELADVTVSVLLGCIVVAAEAWLMS
ncbi:hypothetical protein SUNI508_13227 [Seiridium unicorne]|uniref:Uncharacterized protein n=1 Tax=Seiridium unicorne TaxID=138068 RepID=A0ABR2VEH4_9PEZI